MTYHSAVSLDVMETGARAGHCYLERDGIALAPGVVLQRVAEARAWGYAYWPPCENVRPDGRCAGHEGEAKP